jgi:4-amino-4-deoxy-L-arabinose transferase-like glycosyltransferase
LPALLAASRLRPTVRQSALALAAVMLVVYLWSLGATGPWDPWETHYGEVARQIVVRHDPLDLWWQPGNGGPDGAAEKSFASKPALPFWLMALSMKLFGVGTSPDPGEMVRSPWPELAIRLPSLLAGMGGALFLGWVAARLSRPRAGVLVALVLATTPQWAIVTRQALTDMFFVVPVAVAAGAWLMAWYQPDRELQTRALGRLRARIPWDRAYAGFVLVLILAAIVPLAVLHAHSFDPLTWKQFGRIARRAQGLRDIQQHMWIYWGLVALVVVATSRWRRRSQVWMGVLYLAAGLSLIGKGLIGPGLVGVIVLVDLVVTGRWDRLRRAGLPIGAVLFVLPSFPWHHAMMLYRGEGWARELIVENNLMRFGTGEQKQAVGGFAFYLETLGLAALPWVAVVPAALVAAVRSLGRTGEDEEPRAALARFGVQWFAISLLVLSYSTTKYYHYLLPALPPLALVVGGWLDRTLDDRGRSLAAAVLCALGLALLVAIVRDAIHSPAWLAHLTTYLYTGMWTEGAPPLDRLALTCAPFAVGLSLWAIGRARAAIGAFALSGVLTTAVVVDDYLPAASESWSQRSALRIYYDERREGDRLVSWWFYYRGETFLSKADIWVLKNPDKKALGELVEEHRGQDHSLWFITTSAHASRLRSNLPADLRDAVVERWVSFHYALLRVDVP